MIVDTYASTKFEAGPARAVMAMPCLGFLKYRGSTGTGLAQPKPTAIIMIRPKGSRWRRGFRESRWLCLAVGSPR